MCYVKVWKYITAICTLVLRIGFLIRWAILVLNLHEFEIVFRLVIIELRHHKNYNLVYEETEISLSKTLWNKVLMSKSDNVLGLQLLRWNLHDTLMYTNIKYIAVGILINLSLYSPWVLLPFLLPFLLLPSLC